jgi:hypothetical protein
MWVCLAQWQAASTTREDLTAAMPPRRALKIGANLKLERSTNPSFSLEGSDSTGLWRILDPEFLKNKLGISPRVS